MIVGKCAMKPLKESKRVFVRDPKGKKTSQHFQQNFTIVKNANLV